MKSWLKTYSLHCRTILMRSPSYRRSSKTNPAAVVNDSPGMVKIDCPRRLVIRRETVEEKIGGDFNLQDIHLTLISLAGNIEEDDDEFVLQWNI